MTRAVIHQDEKKANHYKLLVEGDNLRAVMATRGKLLSSQFKTIKNKRKEAMNVQHIIVVIIIVLNQKFWGDSVTDVAGWKVWYLKRSLQVDGKSDGSIELTVGFLENLLSFLYILSLY